MKNIIEDLQPHGRQMLEQLDLEEGVPHPPSRAELMEHVVEGDSHPETAIQNHRHCFPNDLP